MRRPLLDRLALEAAEQEAADALFACDVCDDLDNRGADPCPSCVAKLRRLAASRAHADVGRGLQEVA